MRSFISTTLLASLTSLASLALASPLLPSPIITETVGPVETLFPDPFPPFPEPSCTPGQLICILQENGCKDGFFGVCIDQCTGVLPEPPPCSTLSNSTSSPTPDYPVPTPIDLPVPIDTDLPIDPLPTIRPISTTPDYPVPTPDY